MEFCKPCISSGGGGFDLPALENPASAAEILSGFQAVDGGGAVVTGEYVPPVVPVTVTVNVSNNVTDSVKLFHAGGTQTLAAKTSADIECYTGAVVAIETPTVSSNAGIDSGTTLAGYDTYGEKKIMVFKVKSGSKIWIG
ncbi:MAG: hypothetical protein IJW78_04770 [Clostridia bacterium]|nr:hypothetical protein [Clostridia bacterium]